jgi:hypothetical protein
MLATVTGTKTPLCPHAATAARLRRDESCRYRANPRQRAGRRFTPNTLPQIADNYGAQIGAPHARTGGRRPRPAPFRASPRKRRPRLFPKRQAGDGQPGIHEPHERHEQNAIGRQRISPVREVREVRRHPSPPDDRLAPRAPKLPEVFHVKPQITVNYGPPAATTRTNPTPSPRRKTHIHFDPRCQRPGGAKTANGKGPTVTIRCPGFSSGGKRSLGRLGSGRRKPTAENDSDPFFGPFFAASHRRTGAHFPPLRTTCPSRSARH